jgi:hypothetical protein
LVDLLELQDGCLRHAVRDDMYAVRSTQGLVLFKYSVMEMHVQWLEK